MRAQVRQSKKDFPRLEKPFKNECRAELRKQAKAQRLGDSNRSEGKGLRFIRRKTTGKAPRPATSERGRNPRQCRDDQEERRDYIFVSRVVRDRWGASTKGGSERQGQDTWRKGDSSTEPHSA